MQKLLNIEQKNFTTFLFESKLKIIGGMWTLLWYCWKALCKHDLMKVNWNLKKNVRCGRYRILNKL